MKNTKAILAGALIAPALALTGGIAYASTTTPSHPVPARATVTATAQHPIGQARLGWCDWRYTGHWCNWRDHGYHAQPAQQHRAGRHHNGYQHRGGYRTWANQRGYSGGQGNQAYSYRGNGYQSGWGNGGSHWGNGGCCRHGW